MGEMYLRAGSNRACTTWGFDHFRVVLIILSMSCMEVAIPWSRGRYTPDWSSVALSLCRQPGHVASWSVGEGP